MAVGGAWWAAGGEIVGSIMYVSESAPKEASCFYTGLVFGMALMGIFLGAAVSSAMHHFMTKAELIDYGWRIPFLCGILVAGVGFMIRRSTMSAGHARGQQHKRAIDPIIEVRGLGGHCLKTYVPSGG
jgi:MFS transporter, MHS family, proline/betaine transporter